MANAFSGLAKEQAGCLQTYLEIRTCEPGTEVVHLGTVAEDMYFVLEGEGKIHRNGLDLGAVKAGDHFGELGLISGRPRSANRDAGVTIAPDDVPSTSILREFIGSGSFEH